MDTSISYRNHILKIRDEVLTVARRHGVGIIALIGSTARAEDGALSDIDFLIEVTGPIPPWFPGGLISDLERLLGRRVNIIETKALLSVFRDKILKNALPL